MMSIGLNKKQLDELKKRGFVEVQSGVYLYSKDSINEEKKTWNSEDCLKDFKFDSSPYWILTDNGVGPIGVDSVSFIYQVN